MIKSLYVILIGLLIFSCSSDDDLMSGERIDGPANVRDTINGQIMFSLDDHVLVDCTEPKNGWYEVGCLVQISKEEREDYKIKKGVELKDLDGKTIGKALNNFPMLMTGESDGMNYGFIVGYTHTKNIKLNSIPENVLCDIINKKGAQTSKSDLLEYIKAFKFESNNVNEYFIYENSIDDPSPRDRITLMFSNDTLLGIIHSRKLKLKNITTYELVRGHNFTPITKMSKSKINDLIESRIKYYSSID